MLVYISALLKFRSIFSSSFSSALSFTSSASSAAYGSSYWGICISSYPFGSSFTVSLSAATTFCTTFFSLLGLLNSPYLFSSSNSSSSICVSSLYNFSFLRFSSLVCASDIRTSALVKLDRRSNISSFLYVRITCWFFWCSTARSFNCASSSATYLVCWLRSSSIYTLCSLVLAIYELRYSCWPYVSFISAWHLPASLNFLARANFFFSPSSLVSFWPFCCIYELCSSVSRSNLLSRSRMNSLPLSICCFSKLRFYFWFSTSFYLVRISFFSWFVRSISLAV